MVFDNKYTLDDYQRVIRRLRGEPEPSDTEISPRISTDISSEPLVPSSPLAYPSVIPSSEPSLQQDDSSEVASVMKLLKPQSVRESDISKSMNLDVGESPDYANLLKIAQESRGSGALAGQLGKAAELIGSGISGYKPVAQSLFDENIKQAGMPVETLQEQIQMQKFDKNAPLSKAFKQYAAKLGVNIKGDLSAADAEKLVPFIFKGFEAEETRKSRKEENEIRREAIKAQKELQLSEKQEQLDTKRFDQLGKTLTAETASSRSAFGRAANNIRSAEAIETLVDQFNGKLDQMDSRQITELARSMDSLLAQGQPTITGTVKLIPSTVQGDIAKISEYIRGIPVGSQQAEFVKRMLETIQREKALAKEQIKRTQGKVLAPYKELEIKYPEKWKNIMDAHGLSDIESTSKSSNKTVVKKGYNSKTDETQLIYSDGSKEIVKGRK